VVQASDLVEVGVGVDAGQGLEHHLQQPMESGRRQPIGSASTLLSMFLKFFVVISDN
jgi:hypothetical protein